MMMMVMVMVMMMAMMMIMIHDDGDDLMMMMVVVAVVMAMMMTMVMIMMMIVMTTAGDLVMTMTVIDNDNKCDSVYDKIAASLDSVSLLSCLIRTQLPGHNEHALSYSLRQAAELLPDSWADPLSDVKLHIRECMLVIFP